MSTFFKILIVILVIILLAMIGTYLLAGSGEKKLTRKAQDTYAPGRFAELSDGRIHYHVFEPTAPYLGRTIVGVHGFSTPNFVYEKQIPALQAAGYRVITFDHYGRGWSDRPKIRYDNALWQRELIELLDHLELNEPVGLMGLSMGGPIVAEFTANHPDRVWKVALIVPAGLSISDSTGGVTGAILATPVLGGWFWKVIVKNAMLADPQYDESRYEAHQRLEADITEQYGYKGYWEALYSTLRHTRMSDRPDLYEGLEASGVPAAAIFGVKDTTVLISSADRAEQVAPSMEVHRMAEGDHALNIRYPDETNDWLIGFFVK